MTKNKFTRTVALAAAALIATSSVTLADSSARKDLREASGTVAVIHVADIPTGSLHRKAVRDALGATPNMAFASACPGSFVRLANRGDDTALAGCTQG